MAGDQRGIKCTIMRGGSSKAVIFERSELPPPSPERDRLILEIFGSPDPRQIDGLGGADKLTSKTAIMGPSTRPDCDIDYLFGQVEVSLPRVDWNTVCGNISAAAAAFAVYRGYVPALEPITRVAIHQVNVGRRLLATVPVVDGGPAVKGDFRIGGVPRSGARIDLDYQDFAGCFMRRGLLPSGSPIDQYDIPGLGKLDVTVMDMANLHIFVRAEDVGLDYTQGIEALQNDRELVTRLEAVRTVVASELGYEVGDGADWDLRVRANPHMYVVDIPRSYTALGGATVAQEDTDLFGRSIARWFFSKAYPGTGAVATGVCCALPDTIPAEMVRGGPPLRGEARRVRIGHPSGIFEVEAAMAVGDDLQVARASIGRTARVLMEGFAFVRK